MLKDSANFSFPYRFQQYSRPPGAALSNKLTDDDVPHVTIIRPCKGREPYLYECLASSLKQEYPAQKLTVYFCVSTRNDSACAVIEKVLDEFNKLDARLLVEDEDAALQSGRLGPNPKIRNMSRAYREAKGDIVWIVDCNIWSSPGTCGRMVDRLCGLSTSGPVRPFKFVHHLPVAIDVPPGEAFQYESWRAGESRHEQHGTLQTSHATERQALGGRLDEAFLSSSHAKMYTAINAVAVAPCICGKSSMFRRSHLNALTNFDHSTETRFGSGIDYFSENICEDHLIGDLLWRAKIPSTMPAAAKQWRNHGLVWGDLALQPISGMSVIAYIARRVRWLRVRKFTVPVATLVEPGTESMACSLLGAWGLMTVSTMQKYISPSWLTFAAIWFASMTVWMMVDWTVYRLLHSGKTLEPKIVSQSAVPSFVLPVGGSLWQSRRSFTTWALSWISREALTLPIWTWAIWGGVTVVWRDKKLWVGLDMKVHEINEATCDELSRPLLGNVTGDSRASIERDMEGRTAKKRRD